jgi:hypothetical protein
VNRTVDQKHDGTGELCPESPQVGAQTKHDIWTGGRKIEVLAVRRFEPLKSAAAIQLTEIESRTRTKLENQGRTRTLKGFNEVPFLEPGKGHENGRCAFGAGEQRHLHWLIFGHVCLPGTSSPDQ